MNSGTVVALSGGIGGAKLALGLYRVLPPGALTVVCNPGDDFDHLGLRICPDLDTVLYTLAGIANPETGWGRAGEISPCTSNARVGSQRESRGHASPRTLGAASECTRGWCPRATQRCGPS